MRSSVLLAALALLAARRAAAEPGYQRGLFSFGARGSYFWSNSADIGGGKTFGGAQLRMHGSMLGLEASSDYRRFSLPNATEINVFPIHGDALFYFLPGRLSPYLIAGVNWIVASRISGALGSAASRFGVEAGAGLEYVYDDGWSLDLEYRRLWLTDPNVPDSPASDGQYLMAGVNYHFNL